MKRLLILLAALLLLLCSCSGDSSLVIAEGTNHHTITAERCSESDRMELTAQESAEITVSVSIQSSKGSIDLLCNNSVGEVVSQYDDLKEGSYTFRLTGPDTFNIAVTCNRFTGTCSISWEIIGAVATTDETPEVVIVDPKA